MNRGEFNPVCSLDLSSFPFFTTTIAPKFIDGDLYIAPPPSKDLGRIWEEPVPVKVNITPTGVMFPWRRPSPDETWYISAVDYYGSGEDEELRIPSKEELESRLGKGASFERVNVLWGKNCSPKALLQVANSPEFKNVFIVIHCNARGKHRLVQVKPMPV